MNQQSNSEKNPLDELFARRLGNLERPPKPDSFARLQQRMQGGREIPRLVVWRNPNLKMAAAACVLVALLMGWLYSNNQPGNANIGTEQAIAVREHQQNESVNSDGKVATKRTNVNPLPQVARVESAVAPKQSQPKKSEQSTASGTDLADYKQVVASRTTTSQQETLSTATPSSVQKPATETIAAVKTAPTPQTMPTERVLVVTIEEPEALVAARQTAASVVNNMPVLAASPSKEGKATFWQQLKRLKQDDDVARQEGAVDESGLVSRAYKGIKQRLEKDKQTKQ